MAAPDDPRAANFPALVPRRIQREAIVASPQSTSPMTSNAMSGMAERIRWTCRVMAAPDSSRSRKESMYTPSPAKSADTAPASRRFHAAR
jgi:hypothetical protein